MINITDMDKLNEVLKNKLVLVDFWASWCGPCRMLSSVLDDLSVANDKVLIVKVNVDEAKEIASNYNIQTLPTLILFEDGKEIDSKNGFISLSNLSKWIEQYIV